MPAPSWRWRAAALWGAACLTAALAASAGAADNTSWSFEVVELRDVDPDYAVIHLRPTPRGRSYPRTCELLILHSRYQPGKMKRRQRLDRRGHDEAIRLLREALLMNKLVRLGSVDTGFGSDPERSRCEVASRALRVLVEEDGARAVYSFY